MEDSLQLGRGNTLLAPPAAPQGVQQRTCKKGKKAKKSAQLAFPAKCPPHGPVVVGDGKCFATSFTKEHNGKLPAAATAPAA
eukprot:11324870-Prorocentrum_lima.AAC.1